MSNSKSQLLDNENKSFDQAQATKNKDAERAAIAGLLNLTLLPGFAFIWLLIQRKQLILAEGESLIAVHHNFYALKLNLIAAFFLIVVTTLMVLLGGFQSAWTWVYVISYFTLVHSIFILLAVWAYTRANAGKRVVK